MINDSLLRVSDAQAVTATAVSSNSIDLTQHTGIGSEIGEGKPLYMVFTVTTATITTCTSITFNVVNDTVAALTNAATSILASTAAIPVASLTLGAQFVLQIPPVVASLGKRYLGAYYVVAGSNAAAGTLTADICETIQDGKKFFASGFSIT